MDTRTGKIAHVGTSYVQGVPLVSLEQFNENMHKRYSEQRERIPYNGIACPQCGHEMIDDKSGRTYMSMPPQIRVECLECGHTSLRVV